MSRPGRPQIHRDDVREQVKSLLLQGWTVREVEAELGVGKSTVHRIGKEMRAQNDS